MDNSRNSIKIVKTQSLPKVHEADFCFVSFFYDAISVNELPFKNRAIKAKAGLADNTIKYLADYKYGDDLLKKLAAAMR